jgi:plasmid stabilization system protein ParE
MGSAKQPALKVVYAVAARRQLDEIWNWNESQYGADHANKYLEFLEQHIEALSTQHPRERNSELGQS